MTIYLILNLSREKNHSRVKLRGKYFRTISREFLTKQNFEFFRFFFFLIQFYSMTDKRNLSRHAVSL